MKTKLTLLAALLTTASVVIGAESQNLLPPVEYAQADRPNKPENMTGGNVGTLAPAPPVKAKATSWWTDFSVSPYVAWRNVDFAGKPIFGAGIGFGYQINRTVGVHVLNSLFDEPDTLGHDKFGNWTVTKENGWTSGTGIDETEGVARADLNTALGMNKEKFVPFLLASYTHSWERDDEAIGVGGGFDVRLAKNFALEASYRIRSFFDHGEEGIGMAGLHFQW
jgi:hypothetical protein